MMRLAVIIPAYNEEKSLPEVISRIRALDVLAEDVIIPVVVNDCSLDQTAEIARDLNVNMIDLPVNLGIGGAVQTGIIYAYGNGFDYAMQLDGDGQHPPELIPMMLDGIKANNADLLIGSRFIKYTGFQSTWLRRVGIRYFKFVVRLLCGCLVTDCTSGFRIMNRRTMKLAADWYPDEYPEPDSIVYYAYNDVRIKEIPVEMADRLGGQSSIRAFSSVYYMIKVSLAMFFTYLRYRFKKK